VLPRPSPIFHPTAHARWSVAAISVILFISAPHLKYHFLYSLYILFSLHRSRRSSFSRNLYSNICVNVVYFFYNFFFTCFRLFCALFCWTLRRWNSMWKSVFLISVSVWRWGDTVRSSWPYLYLCIANRSDRAWWTSLFDMHKNLGFVERLRWRLK